MAERALHAALEGAQAEIAGPFELSLVFSNDAGQQALNAHWRGKDASTNVLSFPQIEPFEPLEGLIGDIILARETVVKEALEQGKSFNDHFSHLVVHGFLHILGYDHLNDDEALEMEGLETQILSGLGISDPYAG